MRSWIAFAVVALACFWLLRQLPVVGQVPFLAFWLAVLLASLLLGRIGHWWQTRTRLRRELVRLGAVDVPAQQGKLGSLLLAHGRPRAALPQLQAAARGEPEWIEWRWRLAQCYSALHQPAEALAALEPVLARDAEHAFGAAAWLRVQSLLALGRQAEALQALEQHERSHGETPETGCLRGQLLGRAGRRQEARAAFATAIARAANPARHQRWNYALWSWRARWRLWLDRAG